MLPSVKFGSETREPSRSKQRPGKQPGDETDLRRAELDEAQIRNAGEMGIRVTHPSEGWQFWTRRARPSEKLKEYSPRRTAGCFERHSQSSLY